MAIRPAVGAPDWSERHPRGQAKCRRKSLRPGTEDIFFENQQLAMDICNGTIDGIICPRRTECLRTAMLNRENYGVWGGMTPQARLIMRMRYPRMPERWTWRPEAQEDTVERAEIWDAAS